MNTRFLLAIAALVVVLLIAGTAAASSSRFAMVAEFPPDRWGKTPRKASSPGRIWLERFAPDVRSTLEELGFPPSVAIGQAAVETGWGQAGAKNPWGQRGVGDAGSDFITTKEELEPGVLTTQTNQKFARYSSDVAAARGYATFLSGPSYRPAWPLRRSDPGRWLLWLWGMGYATDGGYAAKVVDASRRAAVELDDPNLAVPWSDTHAQLAQAIGAAKAGGNRRKLTQQLLGTAMA